MLRFCRKLINVSCSTRGASSDEQASELSQGLSLLWYNIGPNVVLYSGVNWPILTQKIVRGKQLIWENNKMMRIKHQSVLCFNIEFLIYSFMLMIKLNMIYILIYILPYIFLNSLPMPSSKKIDYSPQYMQSDSFKISIKFHIVIAFGTLF